MSTIKSFDQIVADDIFRYSTGFPGLDEIYGSSMRNGVVSYGLPVGQISLWAGAGGVGKTRIAIEMALKINGTGSRVLFYQNEVTPSAFKSWVKRPVPFPKNLFVHNYSSLEEQINGIASVKPNVIVVDSINMLDGFTNPTKLRQILLDYRKIITENNCHAIFISHLNKEGQVKGNNDIEYLVDTVASLTKTKNITDPGTGGPDESVFQLDIGKNRYGMSGGWVSFKHVDDGVIYLVGSLDEETSTYNEQTSTSGCGYRNDGPILRMSGTNFDQMISPSIPNYIEFLWNMYKNNNKATKDYIRPFIIKHYKEYNLPLPDFDNLFKDRSRDTALFTWIKNLFK